MFDHAHYVPVLRWKSGERGALKALDPTVKATITPLLEPLPGYMRPRRLKGNGPTADDLSVVVPQINDCWGTAAVFVDVGMVRHVPYRGTTTRNVEHFFEALAATGVCVIPVTNLGRETESQKVIREAALVSGNGVAVRVPIGSLRTVNAGRELRALVAYLGVDLGSVDIIVEYGLVGGGDPSLPYVCHRLPEIHRWRTFTVLSGSFPPNLMGFKKPGQYEVQREEWKRWAAEIVSSAGLPRRPSFGDYTIQHPVYYEPVKGANPSASIRYSTDDYWVIMRGEGLRNPGGPGHKQYPANAELLCGRKEFCGPQFSAGDEYIWKIGSHQVDGPGTPETWLRAGINHHLTFAARQIPTIVPAGA
jgi:hypothetical protein